MKDNKIKVEVCKNCGSKDLRKNMKHVQVGFGVVWKHKICPK